MVIVSTGGSGETGLNVAITDFAALIVTWQLSLLITVQASTPDQPVDNQPPVLTFVSIVETGGLQYQHPDLPNRRLFYNPDQVGNFEVRFDATDAGTGMDRVDFPVLAAPWTGGGTDNSPILPYVGAYGFSPVTMPSPGLQILTAYDVAGNSGNGSPKVDVAALRRELREVLDTLSSAPDSAAAQ